MSHTTIYLLTEASDFNGAERNVAGYLESENFFDYSQVRREESGPLDGKLRFLSEFLEGRDLRKEAESFLGDAEEAKNEGDLGMYGYRLIIAGELYSQKLNIGTRVFNIDSGDYSMPDNPEGWWLVVVDFHY